MEYNSISSSWFSYMKVDDIQLNIYFNHKTLLFSGNLRPNQTTWERASWVKCPASSCYCTIRLVFLLTTHTRYKPTEKNEFTK